MVKITRSFILRNRMVFSCVEFRMVKIIRSFILRNRNLMVDQFICQD